MRTALKVLIAVLVGVCLMMGGAIAYYLLEEDKGTLDIARAEREITRSLERTTGASVHVICDEDIPIEKGRISDCRALAEGETYYVRITQDDDEGHISWQLSP